MAYIQSALSGVAPSSPVTVTITGVAAGSTLVVFAIDGTIASTTAFASCSDGTAFTQIGTTQIDTPTASSFALWSRSNVASGSHSVVVTATTPGDGVIVFVVEVSAPASGAVLGFAFSVQASPTTATDALTTGTVSGSWTQAATLIGFGCDTNQNVVNAGTGFTSRATLVGTFTAYVQEETKSVSAPAAATFTNTVNDASFSAAVAIAEPSSQMPGLLKIGGQQEAAMQLPGALMKSMTAAQLIRFPNATKPPLMGKQIWISA
jgi:hypothetical protein